MVPLLAPNPGWSVIEDNEAVTSEAVIKNPACLYPYIRKVEGVAILNGLIYPTYALAPAIRDRLITETTRQELRVIHQRCFSQMACDTDRRELVESLQAVVDDDEADVGTALYDDMNIVADSSSPLLIDQLNITGKRIELPNADNYEEKTHLTLYNNTFGDQVTVCFGSHKPTLKAGCGLVLEARLNSDDTMQWFRAILYNSSQKKDNTNPLLLDLPQRGSGSCRGEFFIPPHMIKTLFERNVDFRKAASPEVCVCGPAMNNAFSQVFLKTKLQPLNLLITSTSSEHTTFVRVIPGESLRREQDGMEAADKKMFVYIHETMAPGDKVVSTTEEQILKHILGIYSNYSIYVVKPDFQMQKDSSCCSLFAIHALESFEQDETIDETIAELAEKQDACINQHAGLYGRRHRTRKDLEKAEYLTDQKYFIKLEDMPVRLLLCNQNKQLFNESEEGHTDKLDTPVDAGGTTLREHFKNHQYDVPSLIPVSTQQEQDTPDQSGPSLPEPVLPTSTTNLYATGLRYQQLLRWQAMKQNLQGTKSMIVAMTTKPPGQSLTHSALQYEPAKSSTDVGEPVPACEKQDIKTCREQHPKRKLLAHYLSLLPEDTTTVTENSSRPVKKRRSAVSSTKKAKTPSRNPQNQKSIKERERDNQLQKADQMLAMTLGLDQPPPRARLMTMAAEKLQSSEEQVHIQGLRITALECELAEVKKILSHFRQNSKLSEPRANSNW